MKGSTASRHRGPGWRFLPSLEALEDRSLPAAIAFQSGAVLTVNGDNRADKFFVNDTGKGIIFVAGPGLARTFFGVGTFDLNTGNGGVTVNYNLNGSVQNRETVNVNLGNGANTLNANLFANVPHGATYRFDVHGGAGVDTVNIVYKGRVNGRLFTTFTDVGQSPQKNGDTVSMQISLRPHSNGLVVPKEVGGDGNDTLTLFVNSRKGDHPTVIGDGAIDGGGGINTGLSALPITEINTQM
jgi:hypothetical protein